MYCAAKIHEDLYWVGGNDRRLALFENVYPIPRGVSYNAYLLLDEKTVLLDTVDQAVGERLFENLEYFLNGRTLDYVVVNHMEPDHCATLAEVLRRYPETVVVGNQKTFGMIGQFFDVDLEGRTLVVKEGDCLRCGRHTLRFVMAPLVHWPEVMVSYDETDKILFSADAFGTFGALSGSLFADEVNFEAEWLDDARRYYTNIVGKYGAQVQNLLKKAAGLDIQMLCPLHGPVWRKNLDWFLEKYDKWSRYEPEEAGVVIAYASVYGGTQEVCELLAGKLAERGAPNLRLYDVSATDPSEILSEIFRFSHFVLASVTYNGGLFPKMETLLGEIKAHNLQNRTVALLQNGSWGPVSGKLMGDVLSSMRGVAILGDKPLTIKSRLKKEQLSELDALADVLAQSVKG